MLAISPSSFLIIPKSSQVRISSALNPKFSTIRSSSSVNEAVLENRQPESSADFPAIKAAKRVVLVRHGQSTWNAEGRIQGSSNFSVLTTKGEAQAETSRQMLLEDSFDVCFTSPLTRSKRTAEIIWGSRKEPMIPDVDLREIDLYIFQGLLKHEGEEKFGTAFRQWKLDAPNFVIDGHYPVRELWTRARSCWDRILAHQSNSVLVVAHNAVNQALVATAIGLGTEYFRVLLQSNCGVSVLDFIPQAENKSPYICLNRLNQVGKPVSVEMEPKLEGISRKVWKIVRVAIFMIKKGLCKKKIVMDLNFMMKRGKIAGKKALGNLMFHNNNHLFSTQYGVGGSSNLTNNAREYEFSCSNTPLYHRYFTNKRKNHHHQNNDHYYMPSPLSLEDGQNYNIEDVNNVLEMILRNDKAAGGVSAPSPALPGVGFGQSPTVQPLRITDSPLLIQNKDHDDEHVDQAAEDFIKDFYSQLKHQN